MIHKLKLPFTFWSKVAKHLTCKTFSRSWYYSKACVFSIIVVPIVVHSLVTNASYICYNYIITSFIVDFIYTWTVTSHVLTILRWFCSSIKIITSTNHKHNQPMMEIHNKTIKWNSFIIRRNITVPSWLNI